MSMEIVYTQSARKDLREIYGYIAHTLLVPGTARKVSDKIMSAVRGLAEMPERNPLYRDEPWRSQGVRFMRVKVTSKNSCTAEQRIFFRILL